MNKQLLERSGSKCEICESSVNLSEYILPETPQTESEKSVVLCEVCLSQINSEADVNTNHWRSLNNSIWSEHRPVQVLSWRMLNRLIENDWARESLDMAYLDDEMLKWAKAAGDDANEEKLVYKDCNGVVLNYGDTVVLTKDLDVKGTSFVAKRGTAVRNIILSQDDSTHIEGKVNGQHIYIVTKYVKKIK